MARTIECCGSDRATPYCPICGRMLANACLAELLRHCRMAADNHRLVVDRLVKHVEERIGSDDDPESIDRSRKRLAKSQKTLVKWEGWTKELGMILGIKGENDPNDDSDLMQYRMDPPHDRRTGSEEG